MIPPRNMPPGILQLVQTFPDKTRKVLQELPTSSKNRDRINQARNDMLMLDSTLDLFVTENHARI
jgi:hypothetical protein